MATSLFAWKTHAFMFLYIMSTKPKKKLKRVIEKASSKLKLLSLATIKIDIISYVHQSY